MSRRGDVIHADAATDWTGDDDVAVVLLHPDVEPDGMPDLRFELHELVLAGVRTIVVDASCLDELPSPVIGALLTAHRACRARGGAVAIRFPSRRALDQLHRTGLWRVFDVDAVSPRLTYPSARRRSSRGTAPA
ncbi:STAS domain-containing protein [Sporichthya brevicatena]|uniref:STAS domain-containing protein n=1 Tax=Sporichthya brevicatena TaxID=171442 RepID=UPI0031CEC33D